MEKQELISNIEKILNDLRKSVTNNDLNAIVYYDVKDEWLDKLNFIHNLECNLFDIEPHTINNSYEKMLLFKRHGGNTLKIDCDVSLRSCVIYALAFDFVTLNSRTLKLQPNYNEYNQKYCFASDNCINFYGDTMNSFKQIVDTYLYFCNKENNKNMLNNSYNIQKFTNLNHTLGNFIPIPFKPPLYFNTTRNKCVGDYWDLTIYKIYNYYKYENDTYLEELVGKNIEAIQILKENYLSYFGKGITGWKTFIEKNYLEPFVDITSSDYIPKEFWENHFSSKIKPQIYEHCESFFELVPTMIEQRGKKIAEKIIDVLKANKTNDEIISKYFNGVE